MQAAELESGLEDVAGEYRVRKEFAGAGRRGGC
jgi:hypothetical protein